MCKQLSGLILFTFYRFGSILLPFRNFFLVKPDKIPKRLPFRKFYYGVFFTIFGILFVMFIQFIRVNKNTFYVYRPYMAFYYFYFKK